LKSPVALKVLVWSRGRLVTLQILIIPSFSLVEETHTSSGQCVSFSLIVEGSGFIAYVVFFFLSSQQLLYPEKHRHHVQGDILRFFLIPSKTLNPTSSFTNLSLILALPEMNVQTPMQNTKPTTVKASQLKQPSAQQALVAIPSLILAG